MATPTRFVYVAARPDGWHKIGTSIDPDFRVRGLSRDIGGHPVTLVHTHDCGQSLQHNNPASQIENIAHWELIDRPNHREWFGVDAQTAISAVTEAARKFAAGHRQKAVFATVKRFSVREDINEKLRRALAPGESRQRFIQMAIENEIARRKAG